LIAEWFFFWIRVSVFFIRVYHMEQLRE